MKLTALRPDARTIRHLLLASILAVAAFLRMYPIDTLPPGLYHDEAVRGEPFLTTGIVTGLSLYTYTSARLIPVLLMAILLAQFAADRRRLLSQWRGLTQMIAVGLVIALPLGICFALQPQLFFSRVNQVSIIGDAPDTANLV